MLHILKYNGIEIARNIEFARTITSQVMGLMFRRSIPPGYAMVFVLKKPSYISIHMLFMRFPIDVIFLDEGKKIAGVFRLNPWTGFKTMKNIKYIIEMNAGTAERYNLSTGGQVEFEGT